MRFATPLLRARLIRRYKRFLADVELPDGRVVVVHCANPGKMTGLAEPGMAVWLEPNDDPKKKLDWGWRLVELPGGHFAGVDTGRANAVVGEGLAAGRIEGLPEFDDVRPEVRFDEGRRVDFLLSGAAGDTHLEVKSVTLSRQAGLAEFPDTVTARGTEHLKALARVARDGGRAALLYLVQRSDCAAVALAADIDPAYAQAASEARAAGVRMLAHGTRITPEGITLGPALPFRG